MDDDTIDNDDGVSPAVADAIAAIAATARTTNQFGDNACLIRLIQLRQLGLLQKEDVHTHKLVFRLFVHPYFFAERCVRFFIEWDPTVLTQTHNYGRLLLHHATRKCTFQGFQVVFDSVIRYYPKKMGITLLFQKTNNNRVTPFQSVCQKYGITVVLEVVEEILTRYHSEETSPLDISEALLSAAINEHLHLDCLFFLLRREPDALVRLLSGFTSNNDNNDDTDNSDEGINYTVNHDDNDDDDKGINRIFEDNSKCGGDSDDDGAGACTGDIKDGNNNKVVVRKRKRRVS